MSKCKQENNLGIVARCRLKSLRRQATGDREGEAPAEPLWVGTLQASKRFTAASPRTVLRRQHATVATEATDIHAAVSANAETRMT